MGSFDNLFTNTVTKDAPVTKDRFSDLFTPVAQPEPDPAMAQYLAKAKAQQLTDPFNPKNPANTEFNTQLNMKTQGPVKNFVSSVVPALKQVNTAIGFSSDSYAANPIYGAYQALTQPSEGSKQVEQAGQVDKLPPVAKQIAQGAIRIFIPGVETLAKQIGTVIGSKGKELPSSLDAFMAGSDTALTFGSVGAVEVIHDLLGNAGDALVNKTTTLKITPEELRTKLANGEIQSPQAQQVAQQLIDKGQSIEATGTEPRGGVSQKVGEAIGGEVKPANPQIKVTQTGEPIAGKLNAPFSNELTVPENKPFFHETNPQTFADNYVKANFSNAITDYKAAAKEFYGSPNVISADVAKTVIPNYKGALAPDYHESSSVIANKLYDSMIQSEKGKGNNTVLFTSGGTGAGKTSALKTVGEKLHEFAIVYDTNLTGVESSTKKVQKALDAGYKVKINYVQREPINAFEKGVLPRTQKEGRVVTIDEHLARHHEAFSTLQELDKKFGNKISIKYIDNTGPVGTAKIVSLDKLPKYDYNNSSLKEQLYEKLKQSETKGEVTAQQAESIRRGRNAVVRRQPQQKRIERPGIDAVRSRTQPVKSVNTFQTKGSDFGNEKVAKAASDINENLVKKGFNSIPESEQAKYTPTTKAEQIKKISDLMSKDIEKAKSIAIGESPIPSGILPQPLFNAIEEYATKNNDIELLRNLAKSPVATQLSEAGQTLGSHGFNDNPNSVVANIQKVTRAREAANKVKGVTKAKLKAQIKAEITRAAPKAKDWASFLQELKCQ